MVSVDLLQQQWHGFCVTYFLRWGTSLHKNPASSRKEGDVMCYSPLDLSSKLTHEENDEFNSHWSCCGYTQASCVSPEVCIVLFWCWVFLTLGSSAQNKAADELPPCICGSVVVERYVWSSLPFPLDQLLQKSLHSSLQHPFAAQHLALTAIFTLLSGPFTCSYSWETPIKQLAFNFLGNNGLYNLRLHYFMEGQVKCALLSFFPSM